MSLQKMAYSILFDICIILTLFTMGAKTESASGGGDDAPDDYEYEDEGIDTDAEYAKFVMTALLFVVILGPPAAYYYCHFYTKRQVGFLRIMSLLYWIIFWIFVPFMITCTTRQCGPLTKTQHISDLMGIILMPIFWIVFMIESWTSHERVRIAKLGHTETVPKYVDRLKNEQPSIVWSAQCYHYETKYQKVSYTDQEGEKVNRQQAVKEKVVTHRESQEFQFGYWRDDSAQTIEGLGKCGGIARIRFGKEIVCGDEDTAHLMNRLKQEFKDRNRDRDKYVDFSEEKNIPGFEAKFTAYTDESCRSCWIGEPQFWIASILCLTWPYRWLLRYKIDRAFFTVKKKLYNSRPEGLDVRIKKEPTVEHTNIEIDTDSFSALPIDIHM